MFTSKNFSTALVVSFILLSAAAAFASCATLKADQAKLNAYSDKLNKGQAYVQSQVNLLQGAKSAWTSASAAEKSAYQAAADADFAYAKNPNPKTLAEKKAKDLAYIKARAWSAKAGNDYHNLVQKVDRLKSILASLVQQVATWKQTVAADQADCAKSGGGRKR